MKRPTTQFKKQANNMKRHYFKEDSQMANEHTKRCSTALLIWERQIKTTIQN